MTADLAFGLRDPGQPVAVPEAVADPVFCLFQVPRRNRWAFFVVLLLEHPSEFGQAARIDGTRGANGEF
ncbi:hypothetical protein AMK29_18760 [Streptomyces sp. CB02261]|nr:hypothetical protein AMK29_18760 [Streptomyces sp. CB02261]